LHGSATDAGLRPSVQFITRSAFWQEGAGHWARVRALLPGLCAASRLQVIFAGVPKQPPTPAQLAALATPFSFESAPETLRGDAAGIHAWVGRRMQRKPAEVCWIDKTELSGFLSFAAASASRVVDTHDLLSQRGPSYLARGLHEAMPLTDAEERAQLAQYDRVLCIQAEDRDLVERWLGPGRALLVPHAVVPCRQALREQVGSIGFIASKWPTNIDGIRWFLEAVWPAVSRPGLWLDLYGWICDAVRTWPPVPGLRLHGHVTDLAGAYARSDLIINPVQAGAGLKVKTVEALAHGLPLLTSSEGARGLRGLDRKALWIADDAADFGAAMNHLIGDFPLRQALAANAFEYARIHLGAEVCFAPVHAWLASRAPRMPQPNAG
jgi:hypothetical protein